MVANKGKDNESIFGVPTRHLKNPVVTLLIGLGIASGGSFVMGGGSKAEASGSDSATTKAITAIQTTQAVQAEQIKNMKEQLDRIERTVNRAWRQEMTQSRELKLESGAGGLNNRDLPGLLKADEWSELENVLTDDGGLFRMRGGQELIQYAPIDPKVFVADANTLGLWHLDEAGGSDAAADTSGNSLNLVKIGATAASSARGIFPVGAPLGRAMVPPSDLGDIFNPNHFLRTIAYTGHQGKSKITFDAWVIIDPDFSGRPVTQTVAGFGSATVSNSGSPLIAIGADLNVETVLHGLTLHRDWDAVAGKDSSDPYVKFVLGTAGIPGTSTEIQSLALPVNRGLHVRGEYDSTTGIMRLIVNGHAHAEATPNGGGVVASTGTGLCFGGNRAGTLAGVGGYFRSIKGVIDEFRLSADVYTDFPFKEPRGIIPEFRKSDGTRQNVCSAEDGLYYTVGGGEWVPISTGFSLSAYWDMRQYGDILYLSNGTDIPRAWDGSRLLPMGEGITPLTLTPSASGSNPAAGVYKYYYTYLYGDYETGPSPIAQITGTGTNINISAIPTRHANCSAIRIYRTLAGGSTFYLLRQIANDPNVDTLSLSGVFASGGAPDLDANADGIADATLSTGQYLQIDAVVAATAMPKWKFGAVGHDRFWLCGSSNAPYQLDYTELGAPDVKPAGNFVQAKADKGPLIGITFYNGEIQASKDGQATLILRGDSPSSWRQFETAHPDLGCIDHWGYVHRTLPRRDGEKTDRYMLCFPARDGFYGCLGGEFFKISDLIHTTIKGLASASGSREVYSTTTQAQFQERLSNGGSASANMSIPRANVDGLTETPGAVKIVNQLDYLALWDRTASSTPTGISGKILSICKGEAEGEFFFATDGDSKLWRTTDNFASVGVVIDLNTSGDTPTANGQSVRVVQIVRKGTAEQYFLFTDKSSGGASGGGYIYKWDQGAGVGSQVYIGATHGVLYYEADTLWQFASNSLPGAQSTNGLGDGDIGISSSNTRVSKQFHYIGNPNQVTGTTPTNNVLLNHQQKPYLTANAAGRMTLLSAPDLTNQSTAILATNIASGSYGPTVPASTYITLRDDASTDVLTPPIVLNGVQYARAYTHPTTNGMQMQFTRREFAAWLGGTVKPQAFWDATVSKLFFVAAGAEDANGNRNSSIFSVTDGINVTPAQIYTATAYISMTTDGTRAYFVDSAPDTTSGFGFIPRLQRFTLASPGTGGSGVTNIANIRGNLTALRLSYNAQSGIIALAGKDFNVSTRNDYQYQGLLGGLTTAGVLTVLDTMTQNNDSGAFPAEIAYQTTTPYAHFAVMQNVQSGELVPIYKLAKELAASTDVTTYKSSAYSGANGTAAPNGIISNLLFVPASGVDGNYLWNDRLYWFANAAVSTDARLLQLGVPGTYTVKATYVGEAKNLGSFTTLGAFNVDYSGQAAFSFSNASGIPGLASAFKQIAPNDKIFGFTPPGAYIQWQFTLTWDYSIAAPLASPRVNFVDVEYFLGTATIPRIVGAHYEGRTYWAVAENGEINNNLVLVYNKSDKWNIYRGWRIKGFGLFRDRLVALQDCQYVQLEKGKTDLGNIIRILAVTGYIVNEPRDKAIKTMQVNLMTYINENFPTKPGYLKIAPYRAGTRLTDAEWVCQIPATGEEVLRQRTPVPINTDPRTFLGGGWARSLAIGFYTSDDTASYAPAVGQNEQVQAAYIKVYVSPPRREINVE